MLEKGFLNFIEKESLFAETDKILLTISGGLDSMVMLELCSRAGFDIGIVHCNFSLRGIESEGDANFVSNIAQNKKMPYFEKSFETEEFAASNNYSIQEAARVLRYQWFEELCQQEGFGCYATAHHFDDQLETFFINLFRGTGVKGLRGILPKNGKCVRPLLFATRDQILEYAVINKVPYREDSSNKSDKYLRNRIRHKILPALESVKPDYKAGFKKTFQLLAGAEDFIDSEIGKFRKCLFREDKDQVLVAIDKINNLPNIEFYLYELLKPFGFNEDAVGNIPALLNRTPGKVFLSKTHQLLIDRDDIIITRIEKLKPEIFSIDAGQFDIDEPLKLTLECLPINEDFVINPDQNIAQLDREKLDFPLQIRKWKKGDYFYPLGMNGRKKLSDYFIDQKFSLLDKQNAWLMLSGKKIVWIIGHRIDDRFKFDPQTKRVFKISIQKP
jgi:tRNA(Ile)-lysidine synthase